MEAAPADIEVAKAGRSQGLGHGPARDVSRAGPRRPYRDGKAAARGSRARPPRGHPCLRSLLGNHLARDARRSRRGRHRDLRGRGSCGTWSRRTAGAWSTPSIADGQVHGGVAQGIGAALFEEVVHDAVLRPDPHREPRRLRHPLGDGRSAHPRSSTWRPRPRTTWAASAGSARGAPSARRPPSRTRSRTPSGSRSRSSPRPRSASSGWSGNSDRASSPEISPTFCCERRSIRCGGPYSLKPLRRSVGYAFSVSRSVRPATAPSRGSRDESR